MVQKCDRQLMEVICRSSKVIFGVAWLYSEDGGYSLGKDGVSKIDVFSEKFQTAFDPPPHFWKIILKFFPKFMTEMAKISNINSSVLEVRGFPNRPSLRKI